MKFKFGMKVRDMFAVKKDIRVLAVGAGAGDVDIDILDEIVHCATQKCGADGMLHTLVRGRTIIKGVKYFETPSENHSIRIGMSL